MHAAAIAFPTAPKAVKAAPVKLSRRMNAEQAFCEIARQCLAQIAANEAGVRAHDVESLHQMRVGLRRLRAALSMFRELVALPASIETELDWLAGVLGPARDWDVLIASTLPRIEPAAPALAQAAHEQARVRHEQAAAALASTRYARLMRSLSGWLDGRGWRDALSKGRKARLSMRVGELAALIFEQDRQRLRKRGRKLKGGSAHERHRLRIAAKRSRYASEFFASLYPGRRVRPYVAALSTLQDELGAMNDAVVADRLLAGLAHQRAGSAADAGFARGFLAAHAADSVAKVRRLWKEFKPLKPPH